MLTVLARLYPIAVWIVINGEVDIYVSEWGKPLLHLQQQQMHQQPRQQPSMSFNVPWSTETF